METAAAPMAPRRVHHTHHHHKQQHRRHKPRWEYTGVFTKAVSSPSKTSSSKTTPTRIVHAAPPLAGSFLSDESMATSRSMTTVASSLDAQTPSHQTQPIASSAGVHGPTLWALPPPRGRAFTDNDALATMGRVAKKRIETLARRDALVGRWRKRRLVTTETPSSPHGFRDSADRVESQVLEFQSPRKDEYKIVARMNIAGSLREIMGVLATDNVAHFHQSMAALFGAQYVTGEKLRASECTGARRSSSTQSARALLLSSHRLSSRPKAASYSAASSSSSCSRLSSFSTASSVSNIKMALNAVTLQLRHGFFRRRLHDWHFLDYLDEKVDAMAVTRVLKTVTSTTSGTHASSSRRPALGELLAGYVIREDPQAQFTRVFFYGEARADRASVASHTKRLLRTMVETLGRLVASVERQRLSALYKLHRTSESVPVAAGRCFVCDARFQTATVRRHSCACCRQSVCRACLEVREIDRTTGDRDGLAATKALAIVHGPPVVTRVRVCRGCVDRVSLPSLVEGKQDKKKKPTRGPIDERGEDEEDDDDDDDNIIVVDSCSDDESDRWEYE